MPTKLASPRFNIGLTLHSEFNINTITLLITAYKNLVVVGLAWSYDPESYAGGSVPAGSLPCRTGQR
jgi:hypothetical protein